MEIQPKNKLAEWLDKIQQDSWQLELIISAFAIFLMIGALDALGSIKLKMSPTLAGMGRTGTFITIAWASLASVCFFFLVNLILHVVLRGLWISAVGLRSVSGDINFDALNLGNRFDRYLRTKTGNFDDYILKLENLCSIIFAFTFLIVFMLISLCIWIFLVAFLFNLITTYLHGMLKTVVATSIAFLFLGSGLTYLIDFVTLGYLKRIKRLERIYYPIYRFYSFITLASFYRPIYYNLIDNKLGRRAGFLLVPYAVAVLWLTSLKADSHVWFPDERKEQEFQKNYYDELRPETSLVGNASIPSRFVQNGFLELFIRYFPSPDDKALAVICPDFKPLKKTGISSKIVFITTDDDAEKLRTAPAKSLACLSALYEIRVNDSLFSAPAFSFFVHPHQNEKGIITTLDVNYLPRGQHEIFIKKRLKAKLNGRDTTQLNDFVRFPFWKE
jgi:hypothetical protein